MKTKRCTGSPQRPRCRNQARPQRTKCNTCRCHLYDDRIRRLYRNLKAHAKARRKPFTLTFDHFAEVATESGYADKTADIGANGLTINRKKPWLGYEDGNIEILTNAENVRQRYVDEKIARYHQQEPPDEELPDNEYPF